MSANLASLLRKHLTDLPTPHIEESFFRRRQPLGTQNVLNFVVVITADLSVSTMMLGQDTRVDRKPYNRNLQDGQTSLNYMPGWQNLRVETETTLKKTRTFSL